MTLDESLATMIRDAVRAEVSPLTAIVAELHEKVTAERKVYSLTDLWQMIGGGKICTFESFRRRKDLPEADSRNGRHLAFSRATADAWLARMMRRKA